MKLHPTIILLSGIVLLPGCHQVDDISGDDVSGNSPIWVSAEPVSPFTRSYVPTGMYDNFKVYAAAETDGTQTIVMNGYDVKFVNNDWSYVTETQRLMYWDSHADRYLFAAGAPVDAVTSMSATSMTLHLENNTEGSVMASEPQAIEHGSTDFGKTVHLRFGYAHCRVCVAFVQNAVAAVTVTDVQLTPHDSIAGQADLAYDYDWSTTPATVTTRLTTTAKSVTPLSFAPVTVPAHTEAAVLSDTKHYCVPDVANPDSWTVSLTCDGERKSASFANSETWQGGKNYIYVFDLTEKSVKLVKVLSQDTFFDCNDIVPGGEFSNTDMIE